MTGVFARKVSNASETRLTPDICVIGAGSGGLSVAAAAAAFGVRVVLVEKGKMGGDCLNYGCVPSKALIAAARHAHAMRNGSRLGIADVAPGIDMARVRDHIAGVIAAIAPNDSIERFTALGVHVVQAQARFVDARTVVAGNTRIRARRFVLATGSSPRVPPIPGIESVGYLTNETIFDLATLPAHLVVLGGGPIALELGQAFRRLGSAVTILEAGTALSKEDPELAAIILRRLRREGVAIREGAKATLVERSDEGGVRVGFETETGVETVEGTHLLVAAGRSSNVSGLGLEEAGIAHDERGLTVGANLRTTNRRVYAVGDVAGSLQFTHAANYHAGLVIRAILFRLPVRESRAAIPRVTFTEPELAHVGLTEADAVARGPLRILRWPYAENDRAQTEHATEGHIKVVAGKRGAILGVTIVGAHAGELLAPWTLAISKGLALRDMTNVVAPYPTLGEIGKRAAISFYAGAARAVAVRRAVGFLRLFG